MCVSSDSVEVCVCASGDCVEVVMVWRVHHSPSPMNSMRGVSDLRNRGRSGWDGSFSQNCVWGGEGGEIYSRSHDTSHTSLESTRPRATIFPFRAYRD